MISESIKVSIQQHFITHNYTINFQVHIQYYSIKLISQKFFINLLYNIRNKLFYTKTLFFN